MRLLTRFTAGLALACASQFATAGLLGSTVSHCANTAYSGLVSADPSACAPATVQPFPASATVTDAVEFSIAGNRFFDVSDDGLSIQYVQPVGSPSPDLIIFVLEENISGVSLIGANPLGVSWTFDGNRLGVLIGSPLRNGSVLLRLDTAVEPEPVPEPGSISLALCALLALSGLNGWKGWRRVRQRC